MRTREWSPRTEEAYLGWIRRFLKFHRDRANQRNAPPNGIAPVRIWAAADGVHPAPRQGPWLGGSAADRAGRKGWKESTHVAPRPSNATARKASGPGGSTTQSRPGWRERMVPIATRHAPQESIRRLRIGVAVRLPRDPRDDGSNNRQARTISSPHYDSAAGGQDGCPEDGNSQDHFVPHAQALIRDPHAHSRNRRPNAATAHGPQEHPNHHDLSTPGSEQRASDEPPGPPFGRLSCNHTAAPHIDYAATPTHVISLPPPRRVARRNDPVAAPPWIKPGRCECAGKRLCCQFVLCCLDVRSTAAQYRGS